MATPLSGRSADLHDHASALKRLSCADIKVVRGGMRPELR